MPMQVNSAQQGIAILIVDDDAFTRKVVRRVLTDLRFTNVSETESAESALALLQGHRFDLIVTDVQMPGINGLELVRRLRAGLTGAARDTRTIVLTSFSNTEVLGVAMALEVNGFLVKPMKPGIVQDKIAQAMAERTNVRPAMGYQSINTDLRTLDAQTQAQGDPGSAGEPPGNDAEDGATPRLRVALGQLQPGMRLAQKVRTFDGTLLLSQGLTLSQLNINRLLELRSIIREDSLWIVHGDAQEATP